MDVNENIEKLIEDMRGCKNDWSRFNTKRNELFGVFLDAFQQGYRLTKTLNPECTYPEPPMGERLTQKDLDKMHFERVWIDYGPTLDSSDERSGEEGVVLYGRLYSIDTLEGAGFEEMLLDAVGHGGEILDYPSGTYTLYRFPKNMKIL